MPSTYSPSLRLELIGAGEQAGTWNTTTNTNLGTLLDSAIAGYTIVPVTSANQAFTALDGAADEARNAVIELTTTTTAAFAVYAPPQEKTYIIFNNTAYTATIYNSTVLGNTTAAGTGVAVSPSSKVMVFTNGTNFTTLTLPTGTVSSVGTSATSVNGITLTGGPITTTGTLTLGGTLSGVSLTTQVTGTLPIANGGTNSTSTTYCSLTSNVSGQLPVGNGGTGLTSPSLLNGSGISVTGAWPNQTITATGGGGTVTQVDGVGTVNGITLTGTVTGAGNLTLGGSLSGSAPSLTVGNASSASFATSASTATTASNATQLSSTNWTVAQSSTSLVMNFNGTPRWSLDSAANMVAVGYVYGDSFFSGTFSQLYVNGAKINVVHGFGPQASGAVFQNASGGVSNSMIFTNNVGTALGSIYMDTAINSVTFNNLSDYRLKNSIAPMTGALEKVALLKPCTYKWNNNNADGQGFIAHELQEVVPACVSGEKDALNEDGSVSPQGVDPRYLVATLTAAIQELKALVDAQATRIATLESR